MRRAWWEPSGFPALVVLYGLVHLALRVWLSSTLTIADPPASPTAPSPPGTYLPPTRGDGQCLIVWEKGRSEAVPDELREGLAAALGATLPAAPPIGAVEMQYHSSTREVLRVRDVLLPEGAGRCR